MIELDQNASSDEECGKIIENGFERKLKDRSKEENEKIMKIVYPDLEKLTEIEKRQKEETIFLTGDMKDISFYSSSEGGLVQRVRMLSINDYYAISCSSFVISEESLYSQEQQLLTVRFNKMTRALQYTKLIQECKQKLKMANVSVKFAEFYKKIIEDCVKARELIPQSSVSLEEVAEHPKAVEECTRLMNTSSKRAEESRPKTEVLTLSGGTKHVFKNDNMIFLAGTNKSVIKWDFKNYIKSSSVFSVAQFENGICIADQTSTFETRVRLFKGYNLKKPIWEKVISDNLGVLRNISLDDKDSITLCFDHHVVFIRNNNTALVLRFFGGDDVCTSSCYNPRLSEIVVGTSLGSLYFFNTSGDQLGYIDMPLEIPVLGLRSLATLILAWDFQGIYRFHVKESEEATPFIFKSGRPMGVSGCGSLICTLTDLGSAWMTNTFSSALSRQILPPKSIRVKEQEFLLDPVTYSYQATFLTRTKLFILYPCGLVTMFEIKK